METTTVFVVDAPGSQAMSSLAETKGAVALLQRAVRAQAWPAQSSTAAAGIEFRPCMLFAAGS
ncbi:MAG: hypothetical protein ACK4F7_03825 [Inhella sp.]